MSLVTVKPGKSSRTPGKHGTGNSVIGQQFGVLQTRVARKTVAAKLGYEPRDIATFDLCAGDGAYGAGQSFRVNTSPGLFAYHALYRSGEPDALPVVHHGYETAHPSFSNLRTMLMHELPQMKNRNRVPYVKQSSSADHVTLRAGEKLTYTLHHGDGAQADLSHVTPYTAAIVFCDPNSMGGSWPLTKEWLAALRQRTALVTIISTMGCNPGGLMMLPLDVRLTWYERVAGQDACAYGWHDTLIAAIAGDSQKWAYALTVPWAFREDTESAVQKAFRKNGGYEMELAWVRHDPEGARRIQDRLFLRGSEREAE